MYICKKCGKSFEKRHSYIGHCSSHNRGKEYGLKRRKPKSKITKKEKVKKDGHKCQYCFKEFKSGISLGGHTATCKQNPNYDKRIKQMSEIGKKKKLKPETKKKISISRIKYLKENPDKVPYRLNHSSKDSYPELTFKKALEDNNISGWIFKYPMSIYEYDFAFPELKIDVEIDGSTHNQEKVKMIDERRDEFSKDEGWKVLRFTAREVKENIDECIEKLKNMLA